MDASAPAVGLPADSPRRPGRSPRALFWRLHQWAGLQVSLFLAFVFVTGTLAVFAHEIDWLTRPAMWSEPVPVEQRVSWGTVGRAVAGHAPRADIVLLRAPLHRRATFDAVVVEDGARRHVYVDPRTGRVTGDGRWFGVQRFLRDAHRRLMVMHTVGGVRVGIVLVCLSSVFLLVSLVTSFWIYRKWWRGFFRWPGGKNTRALTGDLHRFMGLWSLWFVLVMVATGLWYLAEEFGARPPAPGLAVPSTPPDAADARHPATAARALDRGVAAIRTTIPGYRVRTVLWPTARGAHFDVLGSSDRAMLVDHGANRVRVDAFTGDLIQVLDPAALSVHQRISTANNPLHFGTFGGYLTKTLWFLFGLLMSALSVTGVVIHWLRLAKRKRTAPDWRFALAQTWYGMGRARWIALGLTALPFILAPFIA